MRIALIIGVALGLTGLPIEGQNKTSESKGKKEVAENQQNNASKASPSGIAGEASAVDKATAKNDENRHTNPPGGYLDTLISPGNLPNVILAIVGIVGIGVALCTLNWLKEQTGHIERQAKFMRRQVGIMKKQNELQVAVIDLQQRQMRQWVKYGKWRSWMVPNEGYKTNGFPDAYLHITLEIENTTAFPLSLPDSRIVLKWGPAAARRIELRTDTTLLPNVPMLIDFRGWPLTAEQAQTFYGHGLDIRVDGNLSHIGALGKLTPQRFCGQLTCKASGTIFEEETYRDAQQSSDQPN